MVAPPSSFVAVIPGPADLQPGRHVATDVFRAGRGVVERISVGSRRAHAAVNQELVLTYWAIGHDIVERMHEEGWGAEVVERLSPDIRERFPDSRGYSPRNLRYMRSFAEAWPDRAILQAPLARLPWYHHIALLEKLDRPEQRLWYAQEAIEHGWTRDVLAWHIDRNLHERSGKAISNFAVTLPPADSDMAQQATKDPYVFDFIGVIEHSSPEHGGVLYRISVGIEMASVCQPDSRNRRAHHR